MINHHTHEEIVHLPHHPSFVSSPTGTSGVGSIVSNNSPSGGSNSVSSASSVPSTPSAPSHHHQVVSPPSPSPSSKLAHKSFFIEGLFPHVSKDGHEDAVGETAYETKKRIAQLFLKLYYNKKGPECKANRTGFWKLYHSLVAKKFRLNQAEMGRLITQHVDESLAASILGGNGANDELLKKRKRNKLKHENFERYWVGFEGPNQVDYDPNDIENSLAIQELAKLLALPIEGLEFNEDKFNYEIATSKASEIKAGAKNTIIKIPQFPPMSAYYASESDYILEFDLPGMDVNAIKFIVKSKNRDWTIAGTRTCRPEDKNSDRFFGEFSRSGHLPPDVDLTKKWRQEYKCGVYSVIFMLVADEELYYDQVAVQES